MRKGLYEEASMSGGVPGTQILRTYGLPACVYTELTNMLAKKKKNLETHGCHQTVMLPNKMGGALVLQKAAQRYGPHRNVSPGPAWLLP